MGQFTDSCAPSSLILALSFRGLARTVAFNNERKRSGDFRESAGSGLRERKMCVAGQAFRTQTLRWKLECSICLGRKGSRPGQRDKLCGNAATTEASTNPAELSLVGVKGKDFILMHTSNSPGHPRELVCGLELGHWGPAVR